MSERRTLRAFVPSFEELENRSLPVIAPIFSSFTGTPLGGIPQNEGVLVGGSTLIPSTTGLSSFTAFPSPYSGYTFGQISTGGYLPAGYLPIGPDATGGFINPGYYDYRFPPWIPSRGLTLGELVQIFRGHRSVAGGRASGHDEGNHSRHRKPRLPIPFTSNSWNHTETERRLFVRHSLEKLRPGSVRSLPLEEAEKLWGNQRFSPMDFFEGNSEVRASMVVDLIESRHYHGIPFYKVFRDLGPWNGFFLSKEIPAYLIGSRDNAGKGLWLLIFLPDSSGERVGEIAIVKPPFGR